MERRCWTARAYCDGRVVCANVEVNVGFDNRIGLTERERRSVTVRFLDSVEPALHTELVQMARRHGAAARRVAERLEPITLTLSVEEGARIVVIGELRPPQIRSRCDLREIEFEVRETSAPPIPAPIHRTSRHPCGNPATASA